MEKSAINYWAQFFANEKLTPQAIGSANTIKLMELCKKLAETGTPYQGKGVSHVNKIAARRRAVNMAMDMGIDLTAIKKPGMTGGKKPAMGRGLLDIWNEEYQKRFGSTIGTPGEFEVKRRGVSTRLAEQRRRESRPNGLYSCCKQQVGCSHLDSCPLFPLNAKPE